MRRIGAPFSCSGLARYDTLVHGREPAWSEDGTMRWFWIVSVLALFYGCGGDAGHPSQVTRTTGGTTSTGTTGGRSTTGGTKAESGAGGDSTPGSGAAGGEGGEGGEGGATQVDSRAPIVEITSPVAVSDPDDGEVLLSANVAVVCRATKSPVSGSLAVNPASVKIAMLDANGIQQKELSGASTADVDAYAATFAVANLPSGPISFRCKASDVGATPGTGSTQISTFVDHGPDITVTSPTVSDILALKGAVQFEFTVEPMPLADGDLGAEIAEVSLQTFGVPIEIAPAVGRPNVYVAAVNFNDTVLFPEIPSGAIPVLITAANSRRPTSAVGTLSYSFELDGAGPTISISAPGADQIIGPRDELVVFKVSDTPAGVDKNSVTVTLNGKPYVFDPLSTASWSEKNGSYTFKFDSSQLGGSIAEATINVYATDNVGNKAEGQSRVVNLDERPPIVSMDPALVRVALDPGGTTKSICSSLFDPLGSAVSDGDVTQQAALFRVLAWDETNYAPGQNVVYYAGVDKASVRLHLQTDVSQPILRDSDGDGICDQVPSLDKNGKDLVVLGLTALPPGGVLPNTPADITATPTQDKCGLTTEKQVTLCPDHNSDLSYVLRHTGNTISESVIYARDPKAQSPSCAGNTWEVPGLAERGPGWVCLVATASDLAGNEGVSSPLRFCYDPDSSTTCEGMPMPACTDGCRPPPEFPSSLLVY